MSKYTKQVFNNVRLNMFDAYQHFLFYFNQDNYEKIAPHGKYLTKHFSNKLNEIRYRISPGINSIQVLVNWIQEMTLNNQEIMINKYILKFHGSDKSNENTFKTKWGRKIII